MTCVTEGPSAGRSYPSRVEETLAAVLADFRDLPADHSPDEQTAQVLIRLAEAWPGPLEGRDLCDFDALCRELAVTGSLPQRWISGRGKGAASARLPSEYWRLLITVLLAWADRPGASGEEFGLAMKSLNAALCAIDVAEGWADVEGLPELRAWSEGILEPI